MHHHLCFEGELIPAPSPADIGGFPRKNMRFETLPRNLIFKTARAIAWTLFHQPYRTIIAYKIENHNTKNSNKINDLRSPSQKVAVFKCGRETHRHFKTQVPPQENEGVANHAGNHSTSIYYNINKIKDVLYKIESNSKLAKAQRVRTSNRSMFHD